MAFKDLLVLVGNGTNGAGGYGLRLAEACGASLTAAAAVVDLSLPPYIVADMPDDLLAKVQAEGDAKAREALDAFTAKARQTNVPVETLTVRAGSGTIATAVTQAARCYDATVLPQPDPSSGSDGIEVVESVLFESGHPVIVVPYIGAPQEIGTVLIAWDGGQPAARAVSDALPVLALARKVEIVSFGDDRELHPHLSGQDLARHLARHDIQAEARIILGDSVDIADMLLSHAADRGVDMIVMGGYGHSRLRQIVLGGTTRDILRSMTVPVIMSH